MLEISNGFTNSAEFQERYGTLDNAGFMTLLYNNVLDRQPDSAGMAAWTESMNSGKPRAEVVVGFSEFAEHQILCAPYIDDGIMLYGEEDPTPAAVASSGQTPIRWDWWDRHRLGWTRARFLASEEIQPGVFHPASLITRYLALMTCQR